MYKAHHYFNTYWKNDNPAILKNISDGSSQFRRQQSSSLDISIFLNMGLKHVSMLLSYVELQELDMTTFS